MNAVGIDDPVSTVEDVDRTCSFNSSVLGADVRPFGVGRTALHIADRSVNRHPSDDEYRHHVARSATGSGDLCLRTDRPLSPVREHPDETGVPAVSGPGDEIGARGPVRSTSVCDPDGHLVAFARYGERPTEDSDEERSSTYGR